MKVAELTGALLDAAVAKAEGRKFEVDRNGEDGDRWCIVWRNYDGFKHGRRAADRDIFRPSTEWWDGGPIIERERITLGLVTEVGPWTACLDHTAGRTSRGPTPLIAAMRAFVAAKLGEEIDL